MGLKSRIKKDMYPWKIEIDAPLAQSGKRLIDFNEKLIPEGAVGFVYMMNYLDSKNGIMYSYIGKKNFYSKRKKKFGKKALDAMTDKRAKKYETVVKLDYENYFSSNKELKQAYKDGKMIYRTILKICFSKASLTYEETKAQFKHEVLERDHYLNGNILGRFYKGKI
tara:strand:- start:765 stop:1265 length:501 start_codon:yes stop_codon:yes gene_type:complete